MTTSTWEAPRGAGPTKLVAGVPFLLVGLTLAIVPEAAIDAGRDVGDESVAGAVTALGAALAVLGLLFIVLGARKRLRRRRVARDGVRAEGTVTGQRRTLIKVDRRQVMEVTVALDEASGPGEVVVREISGMEAGRRCVVRYDAEDPRHAVLMGKAPLGGAEQALLASVRAWTPG